LEPDHTYWYLTRAAGFVAYLLLFSSAVLGLVMTSDLTGRWYRRFQAYDVHRFLSLLTLGFVVFHVFIVLPDRYIGFSLVELLVPFASPYRPEFMALGILALALLLLVVGSFYARRLVGFRTWRLLHYATFALFVMAMAHGIGAGTDSGQAWAAYFYAGSGLIVFNLALYRALRGSSRGLPEARSDAAESSPAA
jgi:predicted ferric reductase